MRHHTRVVASIAALSILVPHCLAQANHTIDDGPNGLSGSIVVQELIADLNAWEFDPSIASPIGSFPGGTFTTAKVPDQDADGSVVDLRIQADNPADQGYVHWGSAPNFLPFVQDSTWRVTYVVAATGFADPHLNSPQQRFIAPYGFASSVGAHDLFVEGTIAPPNIGASPEFAFTEYDLIFDEFDIAEADDIYVIPPIVSPAFASVESIENTKRLRWDWLDFGQNQAGGGIMELRSVVVMSIDREAFLAEATTEVEVTDFTENVQVARYGGALNTSAAEMTVTFEKDMASIDSVGQTAPLDPPFLLFDTIPLKYDIEGVAMLPFVPSAPFEDRIYRADISLDTSGNTQPVPVIRLILNTFDSVRQSIGVASETFIFSVRLESEDPSQPNPALEQESIATYLRLPSNASTLSGTPVGESIQAVVTSLDQDGPYPNGGIVRVTGMRIDSIPGNVLP